MLRVRILTAVALIGILGAILLAAPAWVFGGVVCVAAGAACYELGRLVFPADIPARCLSAAYGMAVAVAQQWPAWGVPPAAALIGGCFVVSVVHMARAVTLERFVYRVGATCFGAVYVGIGLSYLGWLRAGPHGRAAVIMTIGMVALSDTFAYAVGRGIGRRKLAPLVSPNKTVEGFLAGFAGSVAAAFACRALLWPDLPVAPLVGLGLLIGVVGPLGDLIESAIKRAYHVKDSGALLPGHGGMLDRADAYIFSAPAVYYYLKSVMGVI